MIFMLDESWNKLESKNENLKFKSKGWNLTYYLNWERTNRGKVNNSD